LRRATPSLVRDERGQSFGVQAAVRVGCAVREPHAFGFEPFLLAAGLVGIDLRLAGTWLAVGAKYSLDVRAGRTVLNVLT
jgi:hypothetical protein